MISHTEIDEISLQPRQLLVLHVLAVSNYIVPKTRYDLQRRLVSTLFPLDDSKQHQIPVERHHILTLTLFVDCSVPEWMLK